MRRWFLVPMLALSGCAGAPDAAAPGHRGVGTPGVSRYMPPGQDVSLASEIARCRDAAGTEAGLTTACAQLRATMHNQPGNTAGAS